MIRRKAPVATLALAILGVIGLLPPAAAQAAAPAWALTVSSKPTNLVPGVTNQVYLFLLTNVGGATTTGPITITDQLPAGLTPGTAQVAFAPGGPTETSTPCGVAGQTVTCTWSDPLLPVTPGRTLVGSILFDVSAPDPSVLTNQVDVSGGGAPPIVGSTETTVSSTPAPFDFADAGNGASANVRDAEGHPATQAGSHPDQLSVDFAVTTFDVGDVGTGYPRFFATDGGLRDVSSTLPPGMVVNPSATPVKCTEAQMESDNEGAPCPDAAEVGNANVLITPLGGTGFNFTPTGLYNMVASPGSPAVLAFDAGNLGIYEHLLGGVRAGDYALTADTRDLLARAGNAISGAHVQLWGDPSAASHDFVRGPSCGGVVFGPGCPDPANYEATVPFLTMPTSCSSAPSFDLGIDSWNSPGSFVSRSVPFTDSNGDPTPVVGCAALDYPNTGPNAPTLEARPTTNAADSPSGLSVDLHIPQSESFDTLATAHLRKAVVTLPPGLVLNPSSANGLEGCSSAQVGIDPDTGVADGNEPTCPDASRIGSIEVDTPLLEHPVPGSVYIAKPFDNPFDSLLAIYLVVDDPQTGVLIKLAGHVQADPQTGQLTTTFDENPQLPFSDFKLQFKSGPHAVLRTPPTCGQYSTTSEMTPWSAPESGPPATPEDTYSISQAPGGGTCADTEAQQPNAPSFDAGTVSPIAATYSPFVLHLSRNDGDQTFASLTLSPPPGLLGKLAGTPYCPDAALKAAEEKSGSQEKASPSCPAASKVGTVTVGAGSGPAPYYTQGNAYLAGPYKGEPLSVAIVTPAAAGPYDLGTVVVRSAVHLDPESGQITATSDPIPQILQGIPLDVRSVALSLDKPTFTLNGTSCDPLAVTGSLTSGLGQLAPLSQRFQLAECTGLAFKPKLSLALKGKTNRGADPALTATLTMPPGGANLARASVALPRSEFLDQAHIGTVCTRVQFAADQCPADSVYGSATATTPLLDYTLEGPVYLRSSDHELPDLVLALHGPPSQPVEFDAVGRVDSVRGGIRTTFETVPDAPVSKVVLAMPGGAKSLLENSTNICRAVNRATVELDGQNGKTADSRPALKVAGCKGKAHKKHRHKRRR
jgi:hypothetical protein